MQIVVFFGSFEKNNMRSNIADCNCSAIFKYFFTISAKYPLVMLPLLENKQVQLHYQAEQYELCKIKSCQHLILAFKTGAS